MKNQLEFSRGILMACLVAVFAAGCRAVGPDYKVPATTVPVAWAEADGALKAESADLATWWAAFKDPKLDSLVSRACSANLDVKQAESRIRQSRAQYGVADSALWPSLNADGSYRHGRQGDFKASNNWQAGLDASWELDFFGGNRRATEAATSDITATMEDRRGVLVTLAAEVALDYITLRGVQQQIAVARENLKMQEQSAEIARKRNAGGLTGKLDVVNAEAQVASTRAQIPALETRAIQAMYALELLLALEPSALAAELAAPDAVPMAPPEIPAGLPADLLKRRPDIRSAEARLHSATARIGVAKSDLFPKITLTGSAGISNNNLQPLVSWDNRFYSIGPSVSWPLLNFGRIRSGIKVQDELAEQALLGYKKAVLTALNDVQGSLVAYVKERQHRKELEAAVAANREAVDLATRLYAAGQTDFLNVLNAQRSLLSAQDGATQSDRAIAANLVAVYKALGGGWDTKDGEDKNKNTK